MITRKTHHQLNREKVRAAVSRDAETSAEILNRAGVPTRDGDRVIEEFVAIGLVESVTSDAGTTFYRRVGAVHARPYAEQVLLGHSLRDGDLDLVAFETLTPSYFWDPRNRAIFEIQRWLHENGKPPTLVLVLLAAHRLGREAEVGGAAYVKAIAQRQDDCKHALAIVMAAQQMRQQRQAAQLLTKAPALKHFLAKQVEKLRRRNACLDMPVPLPFLKLAEALSGGFWLGVHILVAASAVGKTTFALIIALHAALEGVPVLYLGLELKPEELTARLLGFRSSARWSDFLQGQGGEAFEQAVADHLTLLEALPFHSEVPPPYSWSADELYDRAAAMRAKYPEEHPGQKPMLIVLDFLQIVGDSPEQREDLRQRIARASYAAAAVARDFNASILLISSTARDSYKLFHLVRGVGKERKTDREMLGSPVDYLGFGKESGEIEYSADSLMVLVRISDPGEPDAPKGGATVYLGIAKQRAGATAWIPFRFDGSKYWEREADDLEADVDDLDDDRGDAPATTKNPFDDIA